MPDFRRRTKPTGQPTNSRQACSEEARQHSRASCTQRGKRQHTTARLAKAAPALLTTEIARAVAAAATATTAATVATATATIAAAVAVVCETLHPRRNLCGKGERRVCEKGELTKLAATVRFLIRANACETEEKNRTSNKREVAPASARSLCKRNQRDAIKSANHV